MEDFGVGLYGFLESFLVILGFCLIFRELGLMGIGLGVVGFSI